MILLLRFFGSVLLICAGAGSGLSAAAHAEKSRRQIHTFARLLTYLAELLDAQALAGPELLQRAAYYPDFSACIPAKAASLACILPPGGLPDALRQEITAALSAAEEAPRLTACAALHRLAALCEAEAAAQTEHCCSARRFWPRLGACLGALAAILLW